MDLPAGPGRAPQTPGDDPLDDKPQMSLEISASDGHLSFPVLLQGLSEEHARLEDRCAALRASFPVLLQGLSEEHARLEHRCAELRANETLLLREIMVMKGHLPAVALDVADGSNCGQLPAVNLQGCMLAKLSSPQPLHSDREEGDDTLPPPPLLPRCLSPVPALPMLAQRLPSNCSAASGASWQAASSAGEVIDKFVDTLGGTGATIDMNALRTTTPCSRGSGAGSRRTSKTSMCSSDRSVEMMQEINAAISMDKRLSKRRRGPKGGLRGKLWEFLTDPQSSTAAYVYREAANPMFLLTVLVAMAQNMNKPLLSGNTALCLEVSFEVIFLADVLLRFLSCPSWRFVLRDPYNFVDLLSAAPLAIRLATFYVGSLGQATMLTVVPVLRMLKMVRRFEKLHLVFTAFLVAFEALPVLLYTLVVIALVFSAMVFLAEDRENIASMPESLWMTIVTMTTVGYGDKVPKSTAGHVIVTVLIITSTLYMAIPLGIVGSAFNRVWEDRERLLLMKRTRQKLLQWDYKPTDIPKLFQIFSRKHEGELIFSEFRRMFREMAVGMDDQMVFDLFQSFDDDGNGRLDSEEFVHGLFPADYVQLYAGGVGPDPGSPRMQERRTSVCSVQSQQMPPQYGSDGKSRMPPRRFSPL